MSCCIRQIVSFCSGHQILLRSEQLMTWWYRQMASGWMQKAGDAILFFCSWRCDILGSRRNGVLSGWCHFVIRRWRHSGLGKWCYGVINSLCHFVLDRCHDVIKNWCYFVLDRWYNGSIKNWRYFVLDRWRHGNIKNWCYFVLEHMMLLCLQIDHVVSRQRMSWLYWLAACIILV